MLSWAILSFIFYVIDFGLHLLILQMLFVGNISKMNEITLNNLGFLISTTESGECVFYD